MTYDPILPVNHSLASAAELRSQLQGLKEEIDAKQSSEALAADITPLASGDCESIAELSMVISDPPEPAEVQAIVIKINEMLNLLRRI